MTKLREDTFAYSVRDAWQRLVAEAAAATSPPTKTLVYYDGAEGGTTCGRGNGSVAVVYLEARSGCGTGVGIGGELAATCDCTGTRACSVTITAGTIVRAVFARG